MSYTPYYIADYDENTGLEQYHEPFLIPDKAFSILEDVFIWRGKVNKRVSIDHLGRLRRVLTTVGMGNIVAPLMAPQTITFNIFSGMGISASEPNAQLQPGSIASPLVITITEFSGVWTITDTLGNGTTTITATVPLPPLVSATINYTTGDLTIVFVNQFASSPATITGAYFPSLPVMGLRILETNVISQQSFIAFDRKYAYSFNTTSLLFQELVAGTTWNGNDSDFFWSTNYWYDTSFPTIPKKLFWATNFNIATPDPIRYYNGTAWTDFAPILKQGFASPPKLIQARILLPFQGMLLAMNTLEKVAGGPTNVQYPNRIRFSKIAADPTIQGALDASSPYEWTTVSSWADSVPAGYGGFIDLPTAEVIVSAGFIKNVLLIKCERSSYKLTFTGVTTFPLIYEKINTELGSESTFSSIEFDNGMITVGNYGITVDDSVSVQRIDRKIPDFAFFISSNNNGVKRVHGLRDFYYELAYWTYPSDSENVYFPDTLLVYNYKNQSFSIFNDSYTCLGYYQRLTNLTWATLDVNTWAEWTSTWNSGVKSASFPDLLGGNQQGYVSHLNQTQLNGISLSITAIDGSTSPTTFTSPAHNFQTGTFIKISDIISDSGPPNYATSLNGNIYKVVKIDADTFSLISSVNPVVKVDLGIGGTYIGNGHIAVMNNLNVTTKRFSPYYEQGGQARLGYIDFLLDNAPQGEVVSNIFVDESTADSITNPSGFSPPDISPIMGSNIVSLAPENLSMIPYQAFQSKIWHRQFVQSVCQNFQIQITMSDEQMFDSSTISNNFVLHAIVLYVSKNARLTQ